MEKFILNFPIHRENPLSKTKSFSHLKYSNISYIFARQLKLTAMKKY